MSRARLVVTAVRLEGRTKSEVARDYGVSRQWVHELVKRFDAEGESGLEPRSRRPRGSPLRTPGATEDEIVELRKELSDQGLDAGAHTIAYHLAKHHGTRPSVATIWRILSRRGFVTPQPQKRPRSSFVRFEADLPNERWQADVTHWKLADDTDVEILNVIDDHSRFLVASDVLVVFKAADVVASFHRAASAHDFPASVLSDNGAVFTAAPRGGRCAMEARDRGARDLLPPLHALSPTDLRQGRALPPDGEEVVGQARACSGHRRAPGSDRSLRRLLQRDPAAPGARTAHTGAGVHREAQGPADASGVRGPASLPDPTGQGRHHRCDHASSQLTAASHRARSEAHWHPGPRVGGRSSRPSPDGGRRAAAGPHLGSEPRLPTPRAVMQGCLETGVNDVSRHHIRGR